MTEDKGADLLTGALRRMAEERALANPLKLGAETTPEEINRLLHDLQVHKIELEMQNDELRRGQLELDTARARYFDLYDLAPVGYLTLDAEGLIREANLTAAKLFGVARTVLAKQALTSYILPEDQDIFYRLRRQLAKRGEAQIGELRMLRADGLVLWVQLQLTSVESGESRITLSDITERKRLEDQLRQTQKLEAIGTLAGGIAHDLNNILTAIIGYSEIVMEKLPPESRLRQDLTHVLTAGIRARDLVKQILTFSRRTAQQLEPLEVQLIVKEALKLIRASLPATIEIREKIDIDCAKVLADPVQIHQVVMNLCTNAYQAMRETGGVMTVSLHLEVLSKAETEELVQGNLLPAPYVVLEVCDTGPGMSQAVQEQIFEPFFTTKETGQGTGLGLAVAHGVALALGGAISVSSQPGRGSTFKVYLPLAEKECQAEVVVPSKILRGCGEKILVVDDDAVIASLHGEVLTNLGFRVAEFTDSALALQAFREEPAGFDLVVSDMSMPKFTGADLAVEVLRIRPGIPIILLTGFSELLDEERAKALGISEFLLKPVNIHELAKAVRNVLDRCK